MEDPQKYEDSSIYKQPSSTFNVHRSRDVVPARVVLYILSFTGFVVSFMMRTDINITIVEMVTHRPPKNNNTFCYVPNYDNVFNNYSNTTNNNFIKNNNGNGEFDWSPTIQGIIISSFYWCYILSQVVGGVLTQNFGTKTVFGGSQLVTAICSLLIPKAAEIHYGAIIVLRSIQGIASGLTWPAMYAVVGHWIPPAERSRFMSSFQGFSFGIGLTYPLCGFILDNFGWRPVFYTTGSVGVLWCIVWYFLAFDTPSIHPRICKRELDFIEGSVCNQVLGCSEEIPVPWKSILTSLPAWAIGITTFGRIWVSYIFITSGPTYMKRVLGLSIQANGILSGAPFICSYFSSVVFCYVADLLVTRRIMSLTNVRKVFTAMAQVIPGILVLLIGYLGCDIVPVLIVWFIAVTFITAAYAGAMANIVDIAPNFAGPVLAFAQTIHMTASFLSPLATGILTDEDQSFDAWNKVFAVTAIISCGTYIMYQIFGTADIQTWNYPDQKLPQSTDDDDVEPLNDSRYKNGKKVSIVSNNSEEP